MTIQSNDLLFFCYRVYPLDPEIEWKRETLDRWTKDLRGRVFQNVQILEDEVSDKAHFTKFKNFEQKKMVQLTLSSFAYLGDRSFAGQAPVPVFGGMGRGHKCLFRLVDENGNEVEDLSVAKRIVGWEGRQPKVSGCTESQGKSDLQVDPMEKDFGTWMGSLIKALGFDRGVGVRRYNGCWIKYEVLEPVELVAPSLDLAALGQSILNSDKVGANGRGSSDR